MEDDQESSFSLEDDPIEGINDVTICKQYGVNLAFSNHLHQQLDSSKLSDEPSKSCYDFFFNNSTFFLEETDRMQLLTLYFNLLSCQLIMSKFC